MTHEQAWHFEALAALLVGALLGALVPPIVALGLAVVGVGLYVTTAIRYSSARSKAKAAAVRADEDARIEAARLAPRSHPTVRV